MSTVTGKISQEEQIQEMNQRPTPSLEWLPATCNSFEEMLLEKTFYYVSIFSSDRKNKH